MHIKNCFLNPVNASATKRMWKSFMTAVPKFSGNMGTTINSLGQGQGQQCSNHERITDFFLKKLICSSTGPLEDLGKLLFQNMFGVLETENIFMPMWIILLQF